MGDAVNQPRFRCACKAHHSTDQFGLCADWKSEDFRSFRLCSFRRLAAFVASHWKRVSYGLTLALDRQPDAETPAWDVKAPDGILW